MKKLFAAGLFAALVSAVTFPAYAEAAEPFSQAIAHYEAERGGYLASAPKIKPDGKLYFLHGKIQLPDDSAAGFLASLAPSEENELLANTLRRARGMGESTDYFGAALPDEFKEYYFDNAQIGGGFDLIGRYVANIKYSTIDGRERQAPVFEAVYFDLWSARQPQSLAAPQQGSAVTVSAYEKCVDEAEFNGEILGCASDEAKAQDARLNAAYKVAMASSNNKNELRAAQRKWIKDRDAECAPDPNDQLGGGMSAMIESVNCIATFTAVRADELEALQR